MLSSNCISSLYRIVFPNGKMYIGIARDVQKRFREHIRGARRGKGTKLCRAIRKYGEESIVAVPMCTGREPYIAELEIRAIEAYDAIDNGYNTSEGGDTGLSLRDPVFAQRFKEAIRRSQTPEVQIKRLNTCKSEEVRARLRAAWARNYERRCEINRAAAKTLKSQVNKLRAMRGVIKDTRKLAALVWMEALLEVQEQGEAERRAGVVYDADALKAEWEAELRAA